jgi:hypothetical protein
MQNKELEPIKKVINVTTKSVDSLVIKDEVTMATASEIRNKLKSYINGLKEKKETVTKPINEALKNLRNMFRPLEDQCNTALETIDNKMIAYQTKQIALEKAKEAKIVAKLEEGKIGIDKAVSKLESIDRADKKVGNTTFIEYQGFEVMDVVMLAEKTGAEYILPNEVKIRQAQKAGIELPGVRYYTEQRPRNNR